MCLQEHPWRMWHCQRCRHRGGVAPCQCVKRAVAVGGVTLFRTRGDVCVCVVHRSRHAMQVTSNGTFPIQQWRCHSASEQPPFNGASASPCLKVLVTSHILAWYHHASLWWHLVSTPPPPSALASDMPHPASASASEPPLGLGLGLGTTTRPRPQPRPRNRHSASASASEPPLGLGLGLGTAIRPRPRTRFGLL